MFENIPQGSVTQGASVLATAELAGAGKAGTKVAGSQEQQIPQALPPAGQTLSSGISQVQQPNVKTEGALAQLPSEPEEFRTAQEPGLESGTQDDAAPPDPAPRLPCLSGGRKGHSVKPRKPAPQAAAASAQPSAQQRLLLLDTWKRSGLPVAEFASLVGVSKHNLYAWKKRFEEFGPAGLMDKPRGGKSGSRLAEVTKRAILMLKTANPQWGLERISDMLSRGPALPASPSAVARVLQEAGLDTPQEPPQAHGQTVRSFERAKPNQLWQTDLFTFVLKRQNRRVYLVAFLDDHSRFIVSYGLYATPSTALVLEVLMAGIASYNAPEEILTDNGPQYVTWRGKSAFSKELEKRGIRQIVASPRRPQTLGKIERFWGTLWREMLESALFLDIEEARRRIGLFIDHYNFQRPHQGLEGLVPADRFFHAAPEVLRTLKSRLAANSLDLARQGVPRQPFYLVGQFGEKSFSVHTEGERVVLTRAGEREELALDSPQAQAVLAQIPPQPGLADLPQPLAPHGAPTGAGPEPGSEEPPQPGVSALDALRPAPAPGQRQPEPQSPREEEGGEA